MKKYYIKDRENGIIEVNKETAKESSIYGEKFDECGHIYGVHNDCNVYGCALCELSVCFACNTGEGSLTTHCCGRDLTKEESRAVYSGKLDYRYGKWIQGVVNNIMVRDKRTIINNHKIIKETFKENIDIMDDLGRRIMEDIKMELEQWG